jgi:hypothetical protein
MPYLPGIRRRVEHRFAADCVLLRPQRVASRHQAVALDFALWSSDRSTPTHAGARRRRRRLLARRAFLALLPPQPIGAEGTK